MKVRKMRRTIIGILICAYCSMSDATESPSIIVRSGVSILDGIGNVASSATNFLANAVEKPRNLLLNATRVTTGYIDSAASKGLEFKLRRLLEKFRARMPYGIADLNVPVLEPLTLDGIWLETNNEEIGNVSLHLDDLTINYLSTFIVDAAKLSLIGPTITLNLTVPEIYVSGFYNISGKLGDIFPVFGSGNFEALIYGSKLYLNTMLGYSAGVYMKSFQLDFGIDSLVLELENFMGGKEIGTVLTEVFQELAPKALEVLKPEVLPVIEEYVSSRANETLYHMTTRDVINFLLGESEFGDIARLLVP